MKLEKKYIRRNTVVIHKTGGFYGRVIRVLPDGKIFWLCVGLHFHINAPENLIVNGYRGTYVEETPWRPGYFDPMTTLRNLKRLARRYHHEYAHNTPLDYEYIERVD